MSSLIQALYYQKDQIGKTFKQSKTRYFWKLRIDHKEVSVEFLNSKFTNKKKVKLNGVVRFEGKTPAFENFCCPLELGPHALLLVYNETDFDLRVNEVFFEELYRQQNTQELWNATETNWESKAKPFKLNPRVVCTTTAREALNFKPYTSGLL